MACPSDEDLACHAGGDDRPEVAAHLAGCAACARVVEIVHHLTPATALVPRPDHGADARVAVAADDHPVPGSVIDRYVVLRQLGRGGMGVVVLAYDPVLDRTVAVKLMRADRASPQLAGRLEREARALARLAHPNVVRVFDAGIWEGRVFMAMEHIEGETVRTWVRSAPRSTAEILRAFADAGRGLVATHDAGFVHRDVKPGNILLGTDGVARLADFGLVGGEATRDGGVEAIPTTAHEPTPTTATACAPLTQPDAAMGTPGYMAPEQRAGGGVGPAADQYGFCASLWDALFGVHPAADQAAGPEPAGERRVPPWLREVLARGLRADPDARWPSMRALLAALAHDPVAARRRRLARGAGAAAIVGLAAVASVGLARDAAPPDRRCRGLDAELAGVWDPGRAAQVERAFLATGRPHAAATYGRVAARLDAYTRRWVEARVETCEATHTRGVQSEAVLDLRMACLDRRLREVGALVGVLAGTGDATALDHAVPALSRLAPLAECADVTSLQVIAALPADAAARAEIDAVRGTLAEARALEVTGQYARGLDLARAAATRARRAGYAPVVAEALHRRGSLEDRAGDARAAEVSFEEGLVAAGQARDDALAAAIWTDLIYVVGGPLARPADALQLRVGAEAAIARAGAEPQAEARLWLALAMARYAKGELGAARDAQERALRLLERALGQDHGELAPPLSTLGNVLFALGAYDEARAAHERALAIFETSLGAEHPSVAATLTNLGLVFQAQGRLDEAGAVHRRALAIHERTLGPDHPVVAATLTNLGLVLLDQGRADAARALHERALAIRERALGADHPDVAVSLDNRGAAAYAEGRFDEARRDHQRALAIRERSLGPTHPDVATSLSNLADAEAGLGDHRAARADHGRALAIWRAALGADHLHLAHAHTGLARDHLALGAPAAACADARRALEIRQGGGASAPELASSRDLVARACGPGGARAHVTPRPEPSDAR